MKYNELLNFEPITEVVKFSRTSETDYQESLVKTFVFSEDFKKHLIPLIIRNLDFNISGTKEFFGLQVVGNYGTGKSHLMSLVSLIAENKELLRLLEEEKSKNDLEAIAGKFKVLRFELGNTESLWEVITFKIENYFSDLGLDFSFDGHGPKTYSEKIQLMMALFEEKFPDKGFLIVIDEMLAYLKGRSTPDKLNSDLAVLQGLGQACDKSKFKFIFGVQEMIYHSPEFQFAADMLLKVNDRYKDIIITKKDVAFIVKSRLLKKNEHQKQKIKEHLDPFCKFFKDMNDRTVDYVDLFPVHPTYFENFEKIRIGKSQREILKTLSNQFLEIIDSEVPTDNPGLLTYDRYWQDIESNHDLMAIPDVRRVKEITDTISDKIDSYFVGARESKKNVASRVANACAIKILQDELDKQNGTNTEHLVDDLCLTDSLATDRDFLIDIIDSTAKHLISATSGQYFDKDNENDQYHLRIEGGVNFDQKIKDYAARMADSQKDEYFFKFLEVNLPLDYDPYRSGFKIYEHSIEWKSHKTFRNGYFFFGNPNEKSTTQPRQHFYIYFMPIFDDTKKKRNNEADEVYFVMDDLSQEFKETVTLYGSALSLEASADSSQKAIYREKIRDLNAKAAALFEKEYTQVTKVDYLGKELPLKGYNLPGLGATKEQIFSDVASTALDKWFEDESPDYPKFLQLNTPISKDNFDRLVKQALLKVEKPEQANRDGEGVLSGLGLWVPGMLDFSHSPYAKSILKTLKNKGEGKVLNRDEILECLWSETNLWVSLDFKIEAELEFIVLATLAALGEIEITFSSGDSVNSTNLDQLNKLDTDQFFSFTHIKPPKGINIAALKELFMGLLGRDLSKQLKDPGTYTILVSTATEWARRTVTLLNKIQGGYKYKEIELVSEDEAIEYRIKFTAFSGFCDKLVNYTTEAKIRNFQFSVEEVKKLMDTKPLIEKLESQLEEVLELEKDISYLYQCKQYLTDDELKLQISNTINSASDILGQNDKGKIDTYKKQLSNYKNLYADWYLKEYLRNRISESDNTMKQSLLDSDSKAICDILQSADFLSNGEYQILLTKIGKLMPADPSVNKEAILISPYHDFNPKDYTQDENLKVSTLKNSMEDLLDRWILILSDTLDDPIVKENMKLLDKNQSKVLSEFKSGIITLDKSNAITIRNAIIDLHNGLDKVELSIESLKSTFNKPMTPDEAMEAFKSYINEISKGKDRSMIRIILK